MLDQAEMILKAQEMNSKMGLEKQKIKIEHGKLLLNEDKADKDFNAKLAAVLSDIHKHNNPIEKEHKQ